MSADIKTRILNAAEVLLAERGFSATSLRDITAAAEVNLAAVNYHFGSKDALMAAMLERRVMPVNEERLRLLDLVEAKTGGGPPEVEKVVRALLAPLRTATGAGARNAKFMRLVGRIHSEGDPQIRQLFLGLFAEVGRRFIAALQRALPEVEPAEVGWRLHFLIGALAHTLVFEQRADTETGPPTAGQDELLEALVRFAVAGMRASGGGTRAAAVTHSPPSRHQPSAALDYES